MRYPRLYTYSIIKVHLFNVRHIKHTLKLFWRRLDPSLAWNHHQVLSKNKDTENFKIELFKVYFKDEITT